jgi:hypothetical protein
MDRVVCRSGACVAGAMVLTLWLAGASSAAAAGWSVQRLPTPNSSARLTAVSCPSLTACIAVGAAEFGSVSSWPLVERWNGKRWTYRQFPGLNGGLSAVSCPSARDCVAVGTATTDSAGHPVLLRWNGRTWSPQEGPDLAAISCTSARFCMGVAASAGSGFTLGFTADQWNGSTWADSYPGAALGPGVEPDAISCASSSDCMAVGAWDIESLCECSLTEHWNGTTWSHPMDPFRNPVGGISCPSPTACTAVSGPTIGPAVGRWNGRTWSTPTTPPSWPLGALSGVSCSSPSACLVVGASFSGGLLVGMWNGSRWSNVGIPRLRELGAGGVSCRKRLMCVVVGHDAKGLFALRTARPLAPAARRRR